MTDIDYTARIAELVATLRERNLTADYLNAPILDAYARISIVADDADREKPERQLIDILNAMLKMRVRLGEVLSDPNRSAWKKHGKRPAFDRLMERLEKREAHGAFCWHVDRLMRQSWDLARLIHFADAGYVITSCFGEYRLDNPDHRLTLTILVGAAEKESADKSRRLTRKAAAAREKGYTDGSHDVFGHRYRSDVGITDEQLAAERDAIAWAVQYLVDGGTLCGIAEEWTARGVRPRRGGRKWTPQNVRSVVLRARHAGLIEHTDATTKITSIVGPLRDGTEPIVSVALFEDMRAIFSMRGRGRPSAATGTHLLTGIARCVCGTRMSGETEGRLVYEDGKPRRNYRCPPRGCNKVRVDGRDTDRWIRDETIRTLAKPAHARSIAKRTESLTKVDGEIAKIQDSRAKLAERLGDGRLEIDSFDVADAAFRRRLDEKRAERETLLAAGASSVASVSDVATLIELWDDESTSIEERRRLVRSAFPYGIEVAPKPRPGFRKTEAETFGRLSIRLAA
jgi:site-specific DNA recombinase